MANAEARAAVVDAALGARRDRLEPLTQEIFELAPSPPPIHADELLRELTFSGVNLRVRSQEGVGGNLLIGPGAASGVDNLVVGNGAALSAGGLVVGTGLTGGEGAVSLRGSEVWADWAVGSPLYEEFNAGGVYLGLVVHGPTAAEAGRVDGLVRGGQGLGAVRLLTSEFYWVDTPEPNSTVLVPWYHTGDQESLQTLDTAARSATVVSSLTASVGPGANASTIVGAVGGSVGEGAAWSTVIGGKDQQAIEPYQVCLAE